MEQPAFEIITPDRHIKIFASGRVEGFGAADRMTVINRIPEAVGRACELVREQFSHEAAGADL